MSLDKILSKTGNFLGKTLLAASLIFNSGCETFPARNNTTQGNQTGNHTSTNIFGNTNFNNPLQSSGGQNQTQGDDQDDNPIQQQEKLQLVRTINLNDVATEIIADGNYLYVAQDGSAGVDIFDISNQTNPVKVAHYVPRDNVSGMFKHENRLYTAETQAGLGIIDVTTPSTPSFLGFAQSFNGLHNDVVVKTFFQPITKIAYVSNTPRGIVKIDVTDPTNCVTLSPDIDVGDGAGDILIGGIFGNLYVETINGGSDIEVRSTPNLDYRGRHTTGGGLLALKQIGTNLWASRENGGYDWLRMTNSPVRDDGYVGPQIFTDASGSLTLNVLALAAFSDGLQIRGYENLLASHSPNSDFTTNKVEFASPYDSKIIYATERSTTASSSESKLKVLTYNP